MAEKTISQITNGEAPITYDTALNLESVLGVSATFCNNYEARYRKTLKRIEEAKRLESELKVYSPKKLIKYS
ncbi:MAG: helix-turn-helix transcriptional regulator [Fusobacteriaceae bacterium]